MTKYDIINTVCEVFGVSHEDLKKRSRAEPLPTARAFIAHFLYTELRMSPREILSIIGNQNYRRTAIYHYIGRETLVEARLPFQKDLKHKVEQIKQMLTQDSK